jgi:hypothetical protein
MANGDVRPCEGSQRKESFVPQPEIISYAGLGKELLLCSGQNIGSRLSPPPVGFDCDCLQSWSAISLFDAAANAFTVR